MSESKTLYISDLDGTLLNQSAKLSGYTKEALNDIIADGVNFSVATARSAASVEKVMVDVKIKMPIVLMNGVLIFDAEQKNYLKVNRLTAETVRIIINTFKELNVTALMYKLKNSVLTTYYESLDQKALRDFVKERMTLYYKTFKQTNHLSDISPEHIIYFTFLDTYENISPVYDALLGLSGINMTMYRDIYSDDLWYLEIFGEEASKRNAVLFIKEKYEFERVVGFGDNLNDLPLFEACDIRIAVKNARPEVISAADYVCDSNEDDGVAKWLLVNR